MRQELVSKNENEHGNGKKAVLMLSGNHCVDWMESDEQTIKCFKRTKYFSVVFLIPLKVNVFTRLVVRSSMTRLLSIRDGTLCHEVICSIRWISVRCM